MTTFQTQCNIYQKQGQIPHLQYMHFPEQTSTSLRQLSLISFLIKEARGTSHLMHWIDVLGTTILCSVRVVLMGPNGSNGCMAPLCYNTPQRPRVYQVPPQHHVLHHHVLRLLRLRAVILGREDIGSARLVHRLGSDWSSIVTIRKVKQNRQLNPSFDAWRSETRKAAGRGTKWWENKGHGVGLQGVAHKTARHFTRGFNGLPCGLSK